MPRQFTCRFVTMDGATKLFCRMTNTSAREVKAELHNMQIGVYGVWEVAEA